MIRRILLFAFIIATLSSFWGCSFVRQSIAALRSTDHFLNYERDPRILYESGAETYADKIANFLPAAIQQIEERQYHPFIKPVRVYVCSSKESFKKYFGADVRAGVSTKLFLSPRIFEYGDEIAKKYLAHELSHLHLQQQTGLYKMIRLPMWFKEGLATYVSSGGGAHLVSDEQAIESIRAGKYFVPNKADGLFFKTTPNDFGLKPHMFYRQSMLFIKYLTDANEVVFRKLLLSVENGERFSMAFEKAYNRKLGERWNDFMKEIGKMG